MQEKEPRRNAAEQTQKAGAGGLSRRQFLVRSAAAAGGVAVASQTPWGQMALATLKPVNVENPLAGYPDRDWEKIYRNQYASDGEFTFFCVPNCTHNCRLKAVTRNGVVVRVEPPYTEGKATDLYGVKTSPAWHPRGCNKGYAYTRRLYGPYRVKYPMVRKMWKQWVADGRPDQSDPAVRAKYFNRGYDDWVRVSWDEAFTLVAGTLLDVMEKYGGEAGTQRLLDQGYEPEMVRAMGGSGAQTIKLRGGMALNGATRIFGMFRFVNMLGLYDGNKGGRGWSSYDWHGDLLPGHPMTHGVKCFDVDLSDFRNAKLLVFLGKNMVENKMADAHWWMQTMERGGKLVNISPEYSPASQKSDYWLPVRPGSDIALMLGVANLIIKNGHVDTAFVHQFTDLPLLVRLDNGQRLSAADVIPGYQVQPLTGYSVTVQKIKPGLRERWGDFVVWDQKAGGVAPITREEVGEYLARTGIDPALEGTYTVTLNDGSSVQVKPLFQIYKEHLADYDLDTVADITEAPRQLIERLAHDLGTIKPASIATGEGINHYFHCGLTGRAAWLVLMLTGNVGKPGANVTHWAGNYRGENFDGLGIYTMEDPTNPNLDPNARPEDITVRKFYYAEHPTYWNYGDKPLKVGDRMVTGRTHMPTPTKVKWVANANLLNNAKWAHHMIANVDKGVEMIVYNEWEWTGSCEHADVVFPVESWSEFTVPDMGSSCSNPFINVWKGGMKPLYDTKQDIQVLAGVAAKLSELTGDPRYRQYWHFVYENQVEVYLQRILDASSTTRGYKVDDLLKTEDREHLMMFRTYPRIPGWEQVYESKPFYTKTGRMEAYKDEPEFMLHGENLIVHREPVEATKYLPNAIVGTHDLIRPDDFGIALDDMGADERQVRNVKMPWGEVKKIPNPLWEAGYRFYFLTPKSRHRVHSSWGSTDWMIIFENDFGDPYRSDKRTPGVGEAQVHMNPEDARDLGIEDGDYVYIDANPADRPYIGWKEDDHYYKVSRLMVRAKYNPAYPRGVTMMKHGYWIASPKTVMAHESRADGRAVSDTGYPAQVRYGSQQSATRAWLQPTHMTDTMVRKDYMGQGIGEGYEPDVHAPNTCPKETLVKITKAEDGGIGGKGVWKPATTGYSPGHENDDMQTYLSGGFIKKA